LATVVHLLLLNTKPGVGIFGSVGSFFYIMALFVVGIDFFFAIKIIRETTEINAYF
jgi:hypothetical protein